MIIIDIEAAGPRLLELIEKARAGEEIVISRDGEPIAKLAPVSDTAGKRELGALQGKLDIPDEFFTPLPDDELEAWLQ